MTASPTDAVPGDVGLPSEEEIRRIVCDHIWLDDDGEAATAAILSLIRPAFEALDHECQSSMTEIARERARADAAEAKLAQAVEALEPFAKMAAAYDGLLEEEDVPVLAQNKLRITLNELRRARSASARGETTILALAEEKQG